MYIWESFRKNTKKLHLGNVSYGRMAENMVKYGI